MARAVGAGLAVIAVAAVSVSSALAKEPPAVCAACVKAHVEHLADPALKGRRCTTDSEAEAARYLVEELKSAKVPGGLPGGGYLQTVGVSTATLAKPATLSIGSEAPWTAGEQFIVTRNAQSVSGALVRVTDAKAPPATVAGAVVFFDPATSDPTGARALGDGAKAVITVANKGQLGAWIATQARAMPSIVDGSAPALTAGPTLIAIRPEAAAALRAAKPGAAVALAVSLGSPNRRETHNVVGVIHGSAPDADRRAVLLTAHYDHLGVRDGKLYPGANDDASGTAAVLEFARMLKAAPQPKRTVYFAMFGCEEEGGFGATYFDGHPPEPLADIAANIEFEMIGVRDPKRPDFLMMTGYDRSNLGPTLAAHGAKIEPDPYPEQHFFRRSDNYALARKGVVAHTISAWPIPPTYHQPSDDPAHVDFDFMAQTIQSMVEPVRWLLNSDFVPAWNPGGKP